MQQWTEFSFILKPSSLGGVGVFAAHDIPKNTQVFLNTFIPRKMRIKDIPATHLQYCIFISDDEVLCPERFDRMEIGWYVNHAHQPNIAKKAAHYVIAIRDIRANEEILLDYNQLEEPEHLKEPYYKST